MITLHRRGVVDEFRSGMVFQRGSLAYDQRGRLYGLNQARFETVAGRRGVRIEERTTNAAVLRSDLQSLAICSSLERDYRRYTRLDEHTYRVEYLQDVSGVGLSPITDNFRWPTDSTHVISAEIIEYYLAPESIGYFGIGRGSYGGSNLHGKNGLGRKVHVYDDTGISVNNADLSVRAAGASDLIKAGSYMTFRFVQAELNRNYTTSWIPGGTTRAAESLTIPTAGVLSPTEGTISMWVYVDSVARRQVTNQYNRVFIIPRYGDLAQGIAVWHSPNTAEWSLQIYDDSGVAKTSRVSDSYTPDGWHLFTVKWSLAEAKFLIDGVVRGTISNPNLPTAFDALLWIGCASANPNSYPNTVYADLHISSIARSDTEIANDYSRGYHVPDQYTTFYHPLDGPDSQRAARSIVV